MLGGDRAARAFCLTAVALVLLALAGCRREEARCAICYMPIPKETRALVRVEGGPDRHVCDPRCPLTFQEETGKPVTLVQVTDYPTGEGLDAKDAFYVVASDVAPDAHTEALRATQAQTAYLHWHRCLPSVVAFGDREAAERFREEHGGKLAGLEDLGFAAAAPQQAAEKKD